MNKSTFFTFAAATLIAGTTVTKASIAEPSLVTPADTFSVDVSAFNAAGTKGYLLTTPEDVMFGTSNTFTGIDGSNTTAAITISSSEAINTPAGTTTDTFSVSTPTNFLGANTYSGITVGQLQLDLGNANSGSDTVDYALPVTNYSSTGYILYSGTTSFALTPGVTLTNNASSLAAAEGVKATGIYSLAVNTFSFSVTYATVPVPEPSTYAFAGIGALALGTVFVRRNRRQAAL